MIDNLEGLTSELGVWLEQQEGVATARYRSQITTLFKFILQTTPQSSGRAVANWKIGVDTPDLTFDPNLGDHPQILKSKKGNFYAAGANHKMGDRGWIEVAMLELHKIVGKRLPMGSKVYITNVVEGDGYGEVRYLDALQDKSGQAYQNLREVNHPYITVAEALIIAGGDSFGTGSGSNYLGDFI